MNIMPINIAGVTILKRVMPEQVCKMRAARRATLASSRPSLNMRAPRERARSKGCELRQGDRRDEERYADCREQCIALRARQVRDQQGAGGGADCLAEVDRRRVEGDRYRRRRGGERDEPRLLGAIAGEYAR